MEAIDGYSWPHSTQRLFGGTMVMSSFEPENRVTPSIMASYAKVSAVLDGFGHLAYGKRHFQYLVGMVRSGRLAHALNDARHHSKLMHDYPFRRSAERRNELRHKAVQHGILVLRLHLA